MRTNSRAEDQTTVKRKFIRYKDGYDYYGICQKTFEKLAKDANATYKVGKLVLVNVEILDQYLETCRIIE